MGRERPALHLRVADTPWKRLRGLIGAARPRPGHGLLLRPCASVHTCFMRLPIDVVFLDDDLAVVRVLPAVRPWRVCRERHARAVLELAAGEAERAGLAAGARIEVSCNSARVRVLLFVLSLVGLVPATPALAQEDGGSCLTQDPPPPGKVEPLRFGITPRLAGTAGAAQEEPAPEDPAKTTAALRALRPNGKQLVLRLNRLFWSEGTAGIRRFGRLVRRYARAGLPSEIQVRYHPPEGREGDIAGFERFVATAVRRLGRRRAVTGFSITNEANLPVSPNTSDGAYEGVVDALVRGVIVARRELKRLGRPRLDVGFNVMWRWSPDSDREFWEDIGAHPDAAAFRKAVHNVGVQVYPGLVWPPSPMPGRTAGDEVAEALTLVRDCYMPKAGLGRRIELWVSENGYATNLGRDEREQRSDLESTLAAVSKWSGALGITDYRYFNLRDNNSDGADLFSAVGLLRDDYEPKPAFAAYRRGILKYGK